MNWDILKTVFITSKCSFIARKHGIRISVCNVWKVLVIYKGTINIIELTPFYYLYKYIKAVIFKYK